MLLILRINVRIDEVLDILLSRAEPQERETFARMDEHSGGAFRLSVLLCECLRILEDYLNRTGDFSRSASLRAIFPFGARPSPWLSRLNSLLRGLSYESLYFPPASARGEERVAQIWSAVVAHISRDETIANPPLQAIHFPPRPPRQRHIESVTEEMSRPFQALPDEVLAFGYHGSIGSNDHVQWLSDCDAVIFLRAGVVGDARRLRKIRPAFMEARRMMKRIDRFQHHGVYVIPEELLSTFPGDYFPPILLRTSSFDVGGNTNLSAHIITSRWFNLVRTLGSSRYLANEATRLGRYNYHMFHFILQLAQLLPCWVVACCERSMNKREAIPWLSERVSNKSRAFLTRTTKIRENWGEIWTRCTAGLGPVTLVREHNLKEETTRFFGGGAKLAEGLQSLARDCPAIAMEALRRPMNGG